MSDADEREQESKSKDRFPDPPEWEYKRKASTNKESDYSGIAQGIKLAYYLIGPLVAGWVVGYFIDRSRGGSDGQLWGAIIGFFAGIAVVAAMMNRPTGGRN